MRARALAADEVSALAGVAGYTPGPGAKGVGVEDAAGVVRGVVICDDWTPNAVRMHVALNGGAGAYRALTLAAFDWVFNQTKREVAFGLVAENNGKSLRLALGLGFRETYRIADGWAPGVALVVLEMRRSECRWIKEST